MTAANNSTFQPEDLSLTKRMIAGAVIGLLVISFFIFRVPNAPEEWGQYWRVRPILLEDFAGAMAGLCNYILIRFHSRFGINKTSAIFASILIALVGLWMGVVLGLVGTMWN